jgi:hypothetical protein
MVVVRPVRVEKSERRDLWVVMRSPQPSLVLSLREATRVQELRCRHHRSGSTKHPDIHAGLAYHQDMVQNQTGEAGKSGTMESTQRASPSRIRREHRDHLLGSWCHLHSLVQHQHEAWLYTLGFQLARYRYRVERTPSAILGEVDPLVPAAHYGLLAGWMRAQYPSQHTRVIVHVSSNAGQSCIVPSSFGEPMPLFSNTSHGGNHAWQFSR